MPWRGRPKTAEWTAKGKQCDVMDFTSGQKQLVWFNVPCRLCFSSILRQERRASAGSVRSWAWRAASKWRGRAIG